MSIDAFDHVSVVYRILLHSELTPYSSNGTEEIYFLIESYLSSFFFFSFCVL